MMGRLFDWLRNVRRQRTSAPWIAMGRRGEDLAHRYLRRRGYTIIARNFRLASGIAEADLIAREGGDLVIVEVKTRASADFGPPDRAIDSEKLLHISRIARDMGRRTGTSMEQVRLDVVTVVMTEPPRIDLWRGALRAEPERDMSRTST